MNKELNKSITKANEEISKIEQYIAMNIFAFDEQDLKVRHAYSCMFDYMEKVEGLFSEDEMYTLFDFWTQEYARDFEEFCNINHLDLESMQKHTQWRPSSFYLTNQLQWLYTELNDINQINTNLTCFIDEYKGIATIEVVGGYIKIHTDDYDNENDIIEDLNHLSNIFEEFKTEVEDIIQMATIIRNYKRGSGLHYEEFMNHVVTERKEENNARAEGLRKLKLPTLVEVLEEYEVSSENINKIVEELA